MGSAWTELRLGKPGACQPRQLDDKQSATGYQGRWTLEACGEPASEPDPGYARGQRSKANRMPLNRPDLRRARKPLLRHCMPLLIWTRNRRASSLLIGGTSVSVTS